MTWRPPSDRRRRARLRDALSSLALVAMICVSILALPIGRIHAHACRIASDIAGHEVPCGLSALNISIGEANHPFISIEVKPLKLPISL